MFRNPFIEMQAVDRAHRIGQQKPVKVHRILVESTVEDRIIVLQNRTRKLVEAGTDLLVQWWRRTRDCSPLSLCSGLSSVAAADKDYI